MPQISSSEDVYRQLVEEADEDWLYGLVAFAVVEEQRIEWTKHFVEHNDQAPSTVDIQHWYEQQPEGVMLRAKGTAENALQLYADEVLQEILETERREVSEGVIVSEIQLARRFWPQFGINVAAGLASAVLFAAVLILVAIIVLTEVSPVNIWKGVIGHQVEESVNGKADSK
ncbi:MAG: hypothetical protein IIA72_08520 [Proteobacteria bacterium]|nr:hypothetical protein [Pseudomonadota bacterium]